jgi:hypothetical protein
MGEEREEPLRIVHGRCAWTAEDLRRDESWIHKLSSVELAFMEAALVHEPPNVYERSEKVPADWQDLVAHINAELREGGRGVFLLRGLNLAGRKREVIASLCVRLANQLGSLVSQNLARDFVRWVEDQGGRAQDDYESRGHRGRTAMLPHSDTADVVGLFCVRSARRGGATTLTSAAAIFNEIVKRHPENLEALRSGFYFDLTGKTEAGVSEKRLPVFELKGNSLACQFNKSRIETGMKRLGVPLNDDETAALECVGTVALHDSLAFRLTLAPGDALFLSNRRVLHARDEYEDWPDPDRKRLLLRIWLEL